MLSSFISAIARSGARRDASEAAGADDWELVEGLDELSEDSTPSPVQTEQACRRAGKVHFGALGARVKNYDPRTPVFSLERENMRGADLLRTVIF